VLVLGPPSDRQKRGPDRAWCCWPFAMGMAGVAKALYRREPPYVNVVIDGHRARISPGGASG
jgi:hypothetical protein